MLASSKTGWKCNHLLHIDVRNYRYISMILGDMFTSDAITWWINAPKSNIFWQLNLSLSRLTTICVWFDVLKNALKSDTCDWRLSMFDLMCHHHLPSVFKCKFRVQMQKKKIGLPMLVRDWWYNVPICWIIWHFFCILAFYLITSGRNLGWKKSIWLSWARPKGWDPWYCAGSCFKQWQEQFKSHQINSEGC